MNIFGEYPDESKIQIMTHETESEIRLYQMFAGQSDSVRLTRAAEFAEVVGKVLRDHGDASSPRSYDRLAGMILALDAISMNRKKRKRP